MRRRVGPYAPDLPREILLKHTGTQYYLKVMLFRFYLAARGLSRIYPTYNVKIFKSSFFQLFDAELKKRFKTIELNFIRPQTMALPSGERLLQYWDIMAWKRFRHWIPNSPEGVKIGINILFFHSKAKRICLNPNKGKLILIEEY